MKEYFFRIYPQSDAFYARMMLKLSIIFFYTTPLPAASGTTWLMNLIYPGYHLLPVAWPCGKSCGYQGQQDSWCIVGLYSYGFFFGLYGWKGTIELFKI